VALAAESSPIPLRELVRRTVRETIDDDCLGLAAQLSYYLCLALFPALLFLLALASFFSLDLLTDDVAAALGAIVSPEVLTLIQDQMRRLADSSDGGVLTIGVAGAIWGSSSALAAIVSAVNRAYDLEETRPWWKVRLTAIALTLALAFLVLAAVALVMAGPKLAAAVGMPIDSAFGRWLWAGACWLSAFAFVAFGVGLVYRYAPDAEQDWTWITPGAVVATLFWMLASFAFKWYVAEFTDYEASYGAVGGIIILLLWLYLSGLGILAGAELNAELDHAAEYGTRPIVNQVSHRRVIGARAARMFAQSHRDRGGS